MIDGGVLRVAAEPGTPPMLFKDGGRYDGFDYAVARAIARRIGVDDVVIVAGKYSELPARLIAGKADVIISGYVADDSITGVDWSDSYLDFGLCLVVRKGSAVRSTADLAGKVVGIFNDPAAEEEVRGLGIGYSRLEKYEDGYFELLDQGKLDGFIYDFPYAQEEIKAFGGRLEIVEFQPLEVELQRRRAARRRDPAEDGELGDPQPAELRRVPADRAQVPRRDRAGAGGESRGRPERLQGPPRRHLLRDRPRPPGKHAPLARDLGGEPQPDRRPKPDRRRLGARPAGTLTPPAPGSTVRHSAVRWIECGLLAG
ncbi:MAG: ABC transporter substrate-binding protein [Thermoanaerobaculia bacterium]